MAAAPADAFNVGRFAPAVPPGDATPWRSVGADEDHLAVLNEAPLGTKLCRYGFYAVVSPLHVRPRDLEPLRRVGDPLGDAAYAAWAASRGGGVSAAGCPVAAARDVLSQLQAPPLAAHPDVAAFLDDAAAVPVWVQPALLARAQAVHWRHAASIGITLLHLSLLGGFGAPHITAVLRCTGYLASGSRDAVYARLMETLQMVLDVFDDGGGGSSGGDGDGPPPPPGGAMLPGGRGWRSVLNVRLLHAAVRARLAAGGPAVYDAGAHGVPINQEDMLVTQLAFSVVVLMGLERGGLAGGLSDADGRAYLHAWRWVGHLMGVLPASFNDEAHMGSLRGAQALLESVAWHAVAPSPAASGALAMGVILAVARRPPLPWTPAQHVAVARALAGRAYADALGLPRLDDPALRARPAEDDGDAATSCAAAAASDASWPAPSALLRQALRAAGVASRRSVALALRSVVGAWDAAAGAAAALTGAGGSDSTVPLVPATSDTDDDDPDGAGAFASSALATLAAAQRLADLPVVGGWVTGSSRAGMRRLVAAVLECAGHPAGRTAFYPRWLPASSAG